MIERTLKTGMYDLDVLHSYQSGRTLRSRGLSASTSGHARAAGPPRLRAAPGRQPHIPVPPLARRVRRELPSEHLPPSHYEPLPEPTPFAPHGVPTNATPDTHYS